MLRDNLEEREQKIFLYEYSMLFIGEGWKTMGIDLREVFAVIGTIGAIIFLLSLTPALIQSSQGNYTGAVDIIVKVTVDEILDHVKWVIAITIIGSLLAIFGIKLKT